MPDKPLTVDEYLSGVDDEKRAALEGLRAQIRAVVPEAEERIAYGIPTYRYEGESLVGFGAGKRHCAFYLMSAGVLDGFEEELADRDSSGGTVRFLPNDPLPDALVRTLIEARIAENRA
jgi:uncharacterized protein YdhG (YjbR/CyaY superfamily)